MCAGAVSEAENTDSLSFTRMKHIGSAPIIESDSNGYGPNWELSPFPFLTLLLDGCVTFRSSLSEVDVDPWFIYLQLIEFRFGVWFENLLHELIFQFVFLTQFQVFHRFWWADPHVAIWRNNIILVVISKRLEWVEFLHQSINDSRSSRVK